MKKRDYLALHTFEIEEDPATGRRKRVMRYVGPLYPIDLDDIRRRRPLMWLLLAFAFAAFITAGCTPAAGQSCIYVLPQFVCTLLPLYYALMAAARITRIKKPLIDEQQRMEGILSVQHAAMGLTLLSAAWFVGEVVMLLLNGVQMNSEWLFLACAAVQSVSGGILYRHMSGVVIGKAQPQEE